MKKVLSEKQVDFGKINVPSSKKQDLVNGVFKKVSSNYDLMNDLMSFGLHRYWKSSFVDWMAPRKNQVLLDLAGGTGDIALEFLKRGGERVFLLDINLDMIIESKVKLNNSHSDKIFLLNANAEEIPFPSNSVDLISIAFGLRNITNRIETLKEVKRVLKDGGRFMCLEFSKVNSPFLKFFYDIWSKDFIPFIGEKVSKDRVSYEYLVESIKRFPNQEDIKSMFNSCGFRSVKVRNFSGGIVAIHSGWKY
jgi:demethylmenaquinone methyltransferase/2-methoxy-6-polyprenyl-1,4-benzoquinol methylase